MSTLPTAAPAPATDGTVRTLPLPARPRRPRVQRPPSQRSAARTVRRSSPPTTAVTWRIDGLPSRPRATTRVPAAEAFGYLLAVGLLLVPVAVWSRGAAWVPVVAAAALGTAAYLLWARRVVVGESYVAVRQLGRYHVATVDHVRHLELRPTGHGGQLCLHTDDGRCMRLRRCEYSVPKVNAALRLLAARHSGTRCSRVGELLELAPADERVVDRYVATAAA